MKEAFKVKEQKMQQETEEQILVSTKYRLQTGCRPLFSGLENNGVQQGIKYFIPWNVITEKQQK